MPQVDDMGAVATHELRRQQWPQAGKRFVMQFDTSIAHAQLTVVAVRSDPLHAGQFDQRSPLRTPDAEIAGAAGPVAACVEQPFQRLGEALA